MCLIIVYLSLQLGAERQATFVKATYLSYLTSLFELQARILWPLSASALLFAVKHLPVYLRLELPRYELFKLSSV